MTFKLEINRTYPKNDPSDPAFARNLVYSIVEPNAQNGMSFSYQQQGRTWSANPGVAGNGSITYYGSRNGSITVSGVAPATFPEEDVKHWTSAFKSAIAYYIDLGAIAASDTSGPLTADQVRAYT